MDTGHGNMQQERVPAPQSANFQLRNQLLQNDIGNIDVRDETPISSNALPPTQHQQQHQQQMRFQQQLGMHQNHQSIQSRVGNGYSSDNNGFNVYNQYPMNNVGNPNAIKRSNNLYGSQKPNKPTHEPRAYSLKQHSISNFFKSKGKKGFMKSHGRSNEEDDEDVEIDDSSAYTFNDIPSIGHKGNKFNHSTDTTPIIPTVITKQHDNMSNTEYRKHITAQKKSALNAMGKQPQDSRTPEPRAMSLQTYGNGNDITNPYQQYQQQIHLQNQYRSQVLSIQNNEFRTQSLTANNSGLLKKFGPSFPANQSYSQINRNSQQAHFTGNYPRTRSMVGPSPDSSYTNGMASRTLTSRPLSFHCQSVNQSNEIQENIPRNHIQTNLVKQTKDSSSFSSDAVTPSIVTRSHGNNSFSSPSDLDHNTLEISSPLKYTIKHDPDKDEIKTRISNPLTALDLSNKQEDALYKRERELAEKERRIKEMENELLRKQLFEKELELKEREAKILNANQNTIKSNSQDIIENQDSDDSFDFNNPLKNNEDTFEFNKNLNFENNTVDKDASNFSGQDINNEINSRNSHPDRKQTNANLELTKVKKFLLKKPSNSIKDEEDSNITDEVQLEPSSNLMSPTIIGHQGSELKCRNFKNRGTIQEKSLPESNTLTSLARHNDDDHFDFDSTVGKPYIPSFTDKNQLVEVNTFKTITISNEQLHIISENQQLTDDLILVSSELAESIKREMLLDERIALLGEKGDVNDIEELSLADFERELRKKSEKIVELIQQLHEERMKRFICEEQLLLQENGAQPSSLELVAKIHELKAKIFELEKKD